MLRTAQPACTGRGRRGSICGTARRPGFSLSQAHPERSLPIPQLFSINTFPISPPFTTLRSCLKYNEYLFQDFPMPHVEALPPSAISDFAAHHNYRASFVPRGALFLPPHRRWPPSASHGWGGSARSHLHFIDRSNPRRQ